MIALYIAKSIRIDQSILELLNVSSSILIAAITVIYVILTYGILSQTQNEQKIAFIQKQLESFYYPLRDELNKIVFETDEGLLIAAEMNGYTLDNDTKNMSYNTGIYDNDEFKKRMGSLKSLMKYRYLATKKIRIGFYNFTTELEIHFNEYQGIIQEEYNILHSRDSLIKEIKQEIEKLEENLADLTGT